MRARRIVALLFAVSVLPVLIPAVAEAATPGTAITGFEVDGDFAYPAAPPIAGATHDWAGLASSTVMGTDLFGFQADNGFKKGSKESDPDGWTITGHKSPGKDDLTRFYAAADQLPSGTTLYLGLERLEISGQGDTHINFELNQKTTMFLNSAGTTVWERTPGDLLVVIDYAGGNNAVNIELRRWAGTKLSGTWDLVSPIPAGAFAGASNLAPVARPAAAPFGGGTVDSYRFIEAAINLTAIFGSSFPGCPGFAQASAKSRASGQSWNSELKDIMMPEPLDLSRCANVHVKKSASQQTVNAGDSYSYTLTATNDDIAAAHDVVVRDDIADSFTNVTAAFDVDPGTAGGTGSCAVAAGNVVTCAIGTLAGTDGNTSGAEPDTAVVTVSVKTTPASCGVIPNVSTVDASDEPAKNQGDNTSNNVNVTVQCPGLHVTKTADHPTVSAGEQIGYTVTLTNDGPGVAAAPQISDALPATPGTSWSVESSFGGAACNIGPGTGILTCSKASLAVHASMGAHVVSGTTPASCAVVPNTAGYSASNDVVASRNTASASTTVQCPDVRVRKSTSTPFATAGDQISYDVTIDNIGTGTAFGVTLNDPMPAGLTWSLSPAVAGCGVNAGTLSCSFVSLASGASVTLHVVATTTAANCGTLNNTATVAATNERAADTGNNSAGPVAIVVNCAHINITKTADAAGVSAGQPIGFTITVGNTGNGEARGVMVNDPLPAVAGTSWSVNGGPAAASCTILGGILTCSIGSLAPHSSTSVHITSPTTQASCATVTNVATVTTTNDGSDRAEASTIVSCPDLRITKVADKGSVNATDQVGFTVTVWNAGPGSAFGVTVHDPLPAGFVWSFDPAVAGCTIDNLGTLDCALGTLTSGQSVSIHVTAASDAADCGQHPNTATADATNDDPVSASATVTVQCGSIHIAKSADHATVSAGEAIGFTVTVNNSGAGDAYGVGVSDPLPAVAGTLWTIDGGDAAGSCGIAGGTLSCTLGTMHAGQSRTVHVSSPTTHASCGVVDNTATATSLNAGGGQASASTTVQCPDLRITKTADAATVSAGSPVGFTVTVSNAGPGKAFGVALNDPLPGSLAWAVDGGTMAGSCSVTLGTLACNAGTLNAGASGTVHVSAPTTQSDCATLNNTGTATATNDDPAQASASTTVQCPGLHITKTADAAAVSAGSPIGFSISVTNSGPGTANDVMISDPLPVGGGIKWSIDGGTAATSCGIAGGTLTCSLGSMASGSSASVHVSSPTTKESCSTYQNTATASASNAPSISASATTRVDCAAIGLAKTPDKATVNAGEAIGFTVTVSNTGAGTATEVAVNDPLPATAGLSWTIDGGTMAGDCKNDGGTLKCSLASLAPAASKMVHITSPTTGATCGPVVNNATVTTGNDGSAQASATVNVACPAGINIVKTGPTLAHVGDTIQYSLTVTSTTISPLSNVTVTDPVCNATPVFVAGDDGDHILQPGESWTYTCNHLVTANDPDPLPNTATAVGEGPLDQHVTDTDSWSVDIIHPAIKIDKTANPTSGNPGNPVVFTYVVTNIGDTTLYSITVDDDKLGHIGNIASLDPGDFATLTKGTTLGAKAVTIVNVGTTSGTDILHKTVTNTDTASVTVVLATKLIQTGVGPIGWRVGILLMVLGGTMLEVSRRRRRREDG